MAYEFNSINTKPQYAQSISSNVDQKIYKDATWQEFNLNRIREIKIVRKNLQATSKALKSLIEKVDTIQDKLAVIEQLLSIYSRLENLYKNLIITLVNNLISGFEQMVSDIRSTGLYFLDLTTYHFDYSDNDDNLDGLDDETQKDLKALKPYWVDEVNPDENKNNIDELDEDEDISQFTFLGDYAKIAGRFKSIVDEKGLKELFARIGKYYHKDTYDSFINKACECLIDGKDVPLRIDDNGEFYEKKMEELVSTFDKTTDRKQKEILRERIQRIARNQNAVQEKTLFEKKYLQAASSFRSGKPNFGKNTIINGYFVMFAVDDFMGIRDQFVELWYSFKNTKFGWSGFGDLEPIFNLDSSDVVVESTTSKIKTEKPWFYGITADMLGKPLFDSLDEFCEKARALTSKYVNSFSLNSWADRVREVITNINRLINVFRSIVQDIIILVDLLDRVLAITGFYILPIKNLYGDNYDVVKYIKQARGIFPSSYTQTYNKLLNESKDYNSSIKSLEERLSVSNLELDWCNQNISGLQDFHNKLSAWYESDYPDLISDYKNNIINNLIDYASTVYGAETNGTTFKYFSIDPTYGTITPKRDVNDLYSTASLMYEYEDNKENAVMAIASCNFSTNISNSEIYNYRDLHNDILNYLNSGEIESESFEIHIDKNKLSIDKQILTGLLSDIVNFIYNNHGVTLDYSSYELNYSNAKSLYLSSFNTYNNYVVLYDAKLEEQTDATAIKNSYLNAIQSQFPSFVDGAMINPGVDTEIWNGYVSAYNAWQTKTSELGVLDGQVNSSLLSLQTNYADYVKKAVFLYKYKKLEQLNDLHILLIDNVYDEIQDEKDDCLETIAINTTLINEIYLNQFWNGLINYSELIDPLRREEWQNRANQLISLYGFSTQSLPKVSYFLNDSPEKIKLLNLFVNPITTIDTVNAVIGFFTSLENRSNFEQFVVAKEDNNSQAAKTKATIANRLKEQFDHIRPRKVIEDDINLQASELDGLQSAYADKQKAVEEAKKAMKDNENTILKTTDELYYGGFLILWGIPNFKQLRVSFDKKVSITGKEVLALSVGDTDENSSEIIWNDVDLSTYVPSSTSSAFLFSPNAENKNKFKKNKPVKITLLYDTFEDKKAIKKIQTIETTIKKVDEILSTDQYINVGAEFNNTFVKGKQQIYENVLPTQNGQSISDISAKVYKDMSDGYSANITKFQNLLSKLG